MPPRPNPPSPFGIHPQVLLDVLLDGNPAVIDADGRAKDVDPFEDAPVLLHSRIRLIRVTVLPDFDGPKKMPVHGTSGTTGSEDCLLLYSGTGKSLIFPIPLFHLPNSKPGSRAASPGVRLCVPTR